MSTIKIIGRNIRFSVLSRIVSIAVSFFLFPFIIKHIGKEVYGIYLIVLTVVGYFGLLDLGVMSALTKYVSEAKGKGDNELKHKIINASFTFYVIVGLIIAFFLFVCALFFTSIFKLQMANINIAKQLFIWGSLFSLFLWPLSTFRGAIQGLNLWDVDAKVNVVAQLVNAVATFYILTNGLGVIQLFILNQIITLSGSLYCYLVVRKRINLRLSFPCMDFATYKTIFNFSFFMFLSSLLTIFVFQIHNIIIGYFVSVAAVSTYAVAYNIQNYLRTINSTLGAPPWIIASEMEGRKDYDGQRKLLFDGTRFMSAVFVPIVLIMLFFVKPFINYWMGPSFQDSIIPAMIIVSFWIFSGTTEIASGMLSAKGIVKIPLLIQVSIAFLNVLIGVVFIKKIGIVAIALGLTVSMALVGVPMYLRLILKKLNVTLSEYLRKSVLGNLALFLVVSLLSVIILKYCYPRNIYITLFEMGSIYLIVLSFYYIVVLKRAERHKIIKLLGLESFFLRKGALFGL